MHTVVRSRINFVAEIIIWAYLVRNLVTLSAGKWGEARKNQLRRAGFGQNRACGVIETNWTFRSHATQQRGDELQTLLGK